MTFSIYLLQNVYLEPIYKDAYSVCYSCILGMAIYTHRETHARFYNYHEPELVTGTCVPGGSLAVTIFDIVVFDLGNNRPRNLYHVLCIINR